MRLRRPTFVQLFFALLMAFGQQQAMLHTLDHDFGRIHSSARDVTGPDEAFCAKCLAIGHLDHAAGGAWAEPALVSHAAPRVAAATGDSAPPVFVGVYLSRAPPSFS